MNKPKAVEGFWDHVLIRPLGALVVQVLKRTSVSPTAVSLFSLLAGFICAWFYYLTEVNSHEMIYALLGGFFLLISSVFDSADGQLARLKNQTTQLGRWIDGIVDSAVVTSIYAGIYFGYSQRVGEYSPWYLLLVIVSVYNHSLHCALAEYQRLLYQFFTDNHRHVLLEESENMGQTVKSAVTHPFFAKIVYVLLKDYGTKQRFFCDSTHKLFREIFYHPHYAARKEQVRIVYKNHQTPMMKYWALLASNSHKIGIVLAAFLPIVSGSVWGEWGMIWYFWYEMILLNALMAALILWQARVDKKLLKDITSSLEG